jgi:DNA-binding NarL/FixJ family response regulator
VVSIRSAVVTLSPILFDLLATLLAGRANLNVVARFNSHEGIESQLAAAMPELILYGLQTGESDSIVSTLLASMPKAKIIVFTSDGRNAFVHTMRPHRHALLDLSPQELVETILDVDPHLHPRPI